MGDRGELLLLSVCCFNLQIQTHTRHSLDLCRVIIAMPVFCGWFGRLIVLCLGLLLKCWLARHLIKPASTKLWMHMRTNTPTNLNICFANRNPLLTLSRAVFAVSGTQARHLPFHTIQRLELARDTVIWVTLQISDPLLFNNIILKTYKTSQKSWKDNHSHHWPYSTFLFHCLFSLLNFCWNLVGRWLSNGKHLLCMVGKRI